MERVKNGFKLTKPRPLVHCTVHHLLTGTIIRIRKFLGSANDRAPGRRQSGLRDGGCRSSLFP